MRGQFHLPFSRCKGDGRHESQHVGIVDENHLGWDEVLLPGIEAAEGDAHGWVIAHQF